MTTKNKIDIIDKNINDLNKKKSQLKTLSKKVIKCNDELFILKQNIYKVFNVFMSDYIKNNGTDNFLNIYVSVTSKHIKTYGDYRTNKNIILTSAEIIGDDDINFYINEDINYVLPYKIVDFEIDELIKIYNYLTGKNLKLNK